MVIIKAVFIDRSHMLRKSLSYVNPMYICTFASKPGHGSHITNAYHISNVSGYDLRLNKNLSNNLSCGAK